MKKLLIFSTLLLCFTTNPKTFSAEEKNEKRYRCIEFWDDDDDDEYPQYAIAESDITLKQWMNWLKSNEKDSDNLKLYNTKMDKFEELIDVYYEKKYLFTRKTIEKIFNKNIIIKRAKEVLDSQEDSLSSSTLR